MILQSLQRCYRLMAADAQFEVAPLGQSMVEIWFEIELRPDGQIAAVYDLRDGKKGKRILVPEQKGRSGKNPPAYVFCDKSKYFFGRELGKGQWVETPGSLENAVAQHQALLADLADEGAQAMLHFLALAQAGELLLDKVPEDVFASGRNLVFRLSGDQRYLHERPMITQRLQERQVSADAGETVRGTCLLSGAKNLPIARTHTLIKGVRGSNTTGATIAGFNFKAVESYGKSQSYNSPVSEQAMFEYTTALNMLLKSPKNRLFIGDTTCVFWNEQEIGGQIDDTMRALLAGLEEEEEAGAALDQKSAGRTANILKRSQQGLYVDETFLQAHNETKVYILGLAPNVARLSVRFWYSDTYGQFVRHLEAHQRDLALVAPFAKMLPPSINDILKAAAALGKLENVPNTLENGLFTAVMENGPYPQGLYQAMLSRLRAECGRPLEEDKDAWKNNRTLYIRAAMLKAHLNRKSRILGDHKEEITVSLNEESQSIGYQLGRAFAVLEAIQKDANGAANIREKYFQSASATPAAVFGRLLGLAQHHLAKSGDKYSNDKLLERILNRIDELPKTLDMEEQGRFILGYYHQRKALFPSSKDKAERKDEDHDSNR